MDKVTLRNKLFEKYFEVSDGVLVTDLVDNLSFIPEVWSKLQALCCKNIEDYDWFGSLKMFKMIEHNRNKYIILKLKMWNYVVIDLDKKRNVTEEEFFDVFDEEFFIKNFGEKKGRDEHTFLNFYYVENYTGDILELINFYIENKHVFCLSSKVDYSLRLGDAWTYFYIDFVNSKAQLGFQTPDQFLYEQLFLNYDLTPSSMQDAQEKIGVDRMNFIFDKIKEIKIPIEFIPKDLYEQYVNQIKYIRKRK